ncbi:MAG: hypothetical protein ACYTAN_10320 [Planctomycetota bacterium]|jgi:hypothetical protein
MRQFAGLSDLGNALDLLAQPDALRKADPATRLLFYLLSNRTFAAFAWHYTITATDVAQSRFFFGDWWKEPAAFRSAVDTNVDGKPGYWSPAERQIQQSKIDQNNIPSQGWAFVPKHIMLEFWTPPATRKAAKVLELRTSTVRNNAVANTTRKGNTILGLSESTANIERLVYNHCDFENAAPPNTAHIGALFPIPLYPGSFIEARGLTGLLLNDIVEIRMLGEWVFDPRHMLEGDEARG